MSFDDALADVKRNIRLDVSEPDARLRILMLQTSYLELCQEDAFVLFPVLDFRQLRETKAPGFPESNQMHFVKDCKITSDEKKKTLLEAH